MGHLIWFVFSFFVIGFELSSAAGPFGQGQKIPEDYYQYSKDNYQYQYSVGEVNKNQNPAASAPQYDTTDYFDVTYDVIEIKAVDYNESSHYGVCGVFPAFNDHYYKESAYFPWMVVLTDDNSNFICLGAIVQNRFILTSSSCVEEIPLKKLRVRYGDFDLLTDLGGSEVYKNFELSVCSKWDIKSYSYNNNDYKYNEPGVSGTYSKSKSNQRYLTLLAPEFELRSYSYYPQIKSLCLPGSPGLSPRSKAFISGTNAYEYASRPKLAECWTGGWYNSEEVELDINLKNDSTNSYVSHYEHSKLPRKAKVKEVKCPYDENYGDDSICLVGVEGFDACVADRGSPVFCYIEDNYQSQSTYTNTNTNYGHNTHQSHNQETHHNSHSGNPYQPHYIKNAQKKDVRKIAVLIGIVQKTTDCYSENSYSMDTSRTDALNYIVALGMTYNAVDFIQSKYTYDDYKCPARPAEYSVTSSTNKKNNYHKKDRKKSNRYSKRKNSKKSSYRRKNHY